MIIKPFVGYNNITLKMNIEDVKKILTLENTIKSQ